MSFELVPVDRLFRGGGVSGGFYKCGKRLVGHFGGVHPKRAHFDRMHR